MPAIGTDPSDGLATPALRVPLSRIPMRVLTRDGDQRERRRSGPQDASGLAFGCRVRAMTPDQADDSEPPPGADSPYVESPPEDLPPVPDDAGDTRGHHLGRLIRHPVTLILGIVLAAIALIAVGTQVNFAAGGGAAAAVIVARADRRLADRQQRRPRGLLQRLRPGARADPDRRQDEPAAGDAAAAKGRQPLRRAALQRRPSRRDGRQPLPLHLRGHEHRLRRQPPDHLRPLHDRDDPAAGDRRIPAGALLPAALRLPLHGLGRGRLPPPPAGRTGVGGASTRSTRSSSAPTTT